jgi:hypothetical protein
MSKLPILPPDDMPPVEVTQLDKMLHYELEQSAGKCFYEVCDRITQTLLANCTWYLTTEGSNLTLVIDCPDVVSFWHIVSNIPQFGNKLERFSTKGKIRVYPPTGKGTPFEIHIHEISAYRDWL